jgi:TAT (twin-arginine translocation) pathway signal sequence/Gluconate 2-dehydrogenase subunit 3
MRLIDKRFKVSRRDMLRTSGAVAAATAMAPAAIVSGKAFAAAPVAVSADTFATLVKMARDLYPHDKVADTYYAAVIEGIDKAAKDDAAAKEMLEKGVQLLDGLSERMGYGKYMANKEEDDRVAVLKEVEKQDSAFFQKIRGSMITGLYNNKELWPMFGYEGESASKGGYINRGFNDLDWV